MAIHTGTHRLAVLMAACTAILGTAAGPGHGGPQVTPASDAVDHGRIAYATFDPADEDEPTSIEVVRPASMSSHKISSFGSDPHWSPRGKRIAIAGCESAASDCLVTIAQADGKPAHELFLPRALPSGSAFEPVVWSPDGRWLAGGVDSSNADLNGLYLVRASDGGGLRRVTSNPGGEDIPGSFSADGHWIVFVRNRLVDGDLLADGLYAVRRDGSRLHRVTPRGTLVNPEHGGRWSPDGRHILFDARPDEGSRFTLWTIRPNGHHLTRIPTPLNCGAPSEDPFGFGCFAPAWSPDGRRLVFSTNDSATGARDLYTIARGGTDLRRVTWLDSGADVPDWTH